MKKYKSFSESAGQEFFGETLGEGILHCGGLTIKPASAHNSIIEPEIKLKPVKILGIVDTSSHTRGGNFYEAVAVEFENGLRLQVDAICEGVLK